MKNSFKKRCNNKIIHFIEDLKLKFNFIHSNFSNQRFPRFVPLSLPILLNIFLFFIQQLHSSLNKSLEFNLSMLKLVQYNRAIDLPLVCSRRLQVAPYVTSVETINQHYVVTYLLTCGLRVYTFCSSHFLVRSRIMRSMIAQSRS